MGFFDALKAMTAPDRYEAKYRGHEIVVEYGTTVLYWYLDGEEVGRETENAPYGKTLSALLTDGSEDKSLELTYRIDQYRLEFVKLKVEGREIPLKRVN